MVSHAPARGSLGVRPRRPYRPRGLLLVIALFLLCGSLSLCPPQLLGLDFRPDSPYVFYDVLWLGNADKDSAPSPLLGVVGVGYRFTFSESLAFDPEIGFYGAEYFYRQGKAYPAEIEYADAVGVLGILLSPLLYYRYPLRGSALVLAGGTGPSFSFKIPLIPHGNAPTREVGTYFLQSGRFLYWETRVSLEWQVTQAIGVLVRIRGVLPLFHLWDGENVPFYDQLFAGAGIGLRVRF